MVLDRVREYGTTRGVIARATLGCTRFDPRVQHQQHQQSHAQREFALVTDKRGARAAAYRVEEPARLWGRFSLRTAGPHAYSTWVSPRKLTRPPCLMWHSCALNWRAVLRSVYYTSEYVRAMFGNNLTGFRLCSILKIALERAFSKEPRKYWKTGMPGAADARGGIQQILRYVCSGIMPWPFAHMKFFSHLSRAVQATKHTSFRLCIMR